MQTSTLPVVIQRLGSGEGLSESVASSVDAVVSSNCAIVDDKSSHPSTEHNSPEMPLQDIEDPEVSFITYCFYY